MASTPLPAAPWRIAIIALSLALNVQQPAMAAGVVGEREQLAALARQLDLADRLADQAASSTPPERARYHFDYARLRTDLKRVRTGVQDYLVPQRAQPRDPALLDGHYTAASTPAEEASP
ncbi:RAQPRD family integrative conjugative element protein [Sodalis ligni]|uniref:RAQPRD family integrative conjugative element protein n=1 Tax=Sodalis ligni TaxID=2697027 RepID=A0A4V2Q2A9_9GAMM|nr:RAQPRD family integrative conjugative element protein [Sodalis ligni]TCL02188.1 RAQPRD family integrative conjugative element protein [Sodalis ligni]